MGRVAPEGGQAPALFPLFTGSRRRVLWRLRHSGSPERDGSPPGSFPTEWPGSRQEVHAWVKHSWSTNNVPCSACWARTGRLSDALDVSRIEAKATPPGCRVAVERRYKPRHSWLGYLTANSSCVLFVVISVPLSFKDRYQKASFVTFLEYI